MKKLLILLFLQAFSLPIASIGLHKQKGNKSKSSQSVNQKSLFKQMIAPQKNVIHLEAFLDNVKGKKLEKEQFLVYLAVLKEYNNQASIQLLEQFIKKNFPKADGPSRKITGHDRRCKALKNIASQTDISALEGFIGGIEDKQLEDEKLSEYLGILEKSNHDPLIQCFKTFMNEATATRERKNTAVQILSVFSEMCFTTQSSDAASLLTGMTHTNVTPTLSDDSDDEEYPLRALLLSEMNLLNWKRENYQNYPSLGV